MTAEQQNEAMRRLIGEIHWMARRYADGRSTYATGMLNDATRQLLRLGVGLKPGSDLLAEIRLKTGLAVIADKNPADDGLFYLCEGDG